MKNAKRILTIFLTVMLVISTMGTLPAMAEAAEDRTLFLFAGDSNYNSNNWSSADSSKSYGTLEVGVTGFGDKAATDLVGKATYGSTGAPQFYFSMPGSLWNDTVRADYSSGYLVLTCELYPDDSFAGFQWTRRYGNTISTSSEKTLYNYIKKGEWNTITTYYNFAANLNNKHTAITYVNGSLVEANANCEAISGDYMHIYTGIYGTPGESFYLDNVAFYMTNDVPPAVVGVTGAAHAAAIFSSDGSSWNVASQAVGTSAANAAMDGEANNVYTEITAADPGDNTPRAVTQFFNTFGPDPANCEYLVMSVQIYPYNASDITSVRWRNRDGSLSVPDSSNCIADALKAGQWNTVTTVYCYREVVDGSDDSHDTYTSFTYVNGEHVYTNKNAHSVIVNNPYNASYNRNSRRIELYVKTSAADTKFGLDNVNIYQTNAIPVLYADDVAVSTDGTEATFGTWQAADGNSATETAFGSVVHNNAGTAGKAAEDVYTTATTDASNNEFRWFIKNSGFPKIYNYLVMSAQILPGNNTDITSVVWRNRDGSLSVPDGSNYISGALEAGKWNTVTTVYCYNEVLENPETSYKEYTSYTYVNGKLVYTKNDAHSVMPADITSSAGNRDNWRIQLTINTNKENDSAETFGLDNVRIYQTNTYPDVTMPAIADSGSYIVNNGMLRLYKDATVAVGDLGGAKVWNSALTEQVTQGNIADGNIVTVEDGNKITYYTVSTLKDYDVVYGGAAYNRAANRVIAGSLTASVYKPDDAEICVITAQFDKSGNLHKAALNKVSGSGLVNTAAFTVDEIAESEITTFVWENTNTLKPLADTATVMYK